MKITYWGNYGHFYHSPRLFRHWKCTSRNEQGFHKAFYSLKLVDLCMLYTALHSKGQTVPFGWPTSKICLILRQSSFHRVSSFSLGSILTERWGVFTPSHIYNAVSASICQNNIENLQTLLVCFTTDFSAFWFACYSLLAFSNYTYLLACQMWWGTFFVFSHSEFQYKYLASNTNSFIWSQLFFLYLTICLWVVFFFLTQH